MIDNPFQWTLVVNWAIATGFGWLFTHPLLHLLALETLPLWGSVVVTLVAAANFVQALARRRRGLEPRWRSIAINTGCALVAVISLALMHPGSIAAVLQWPLLRRHIIGSAWWILASCVGVVITLIIGNVVERGSMYFMYLGFAQTGFVLGLMQWLVLRRQLPSAGWWVVVSPIGWLVGGLGTEAVQDVYNSLSDNLSDHVALVVAHTAPNIIGGALCGAVTAVSLAALLRHQKSYA